MLSDYSNSENAVAFFTQQKISNPQLPPSRLADAVRSPLRLPHQIHLDLADSFHPREPVVHLLKDQPRGRALISSQRHRHLHPLARPCRRRIRGRTGRNCVNQPQIDEVQLHFRIEAIAQCGQDVGFRSIVNAACSLICRNYLLPVSTRYRATAFSPSALLPNGSSAAKASSISRAASRSLCSMPKTAGQVAFSVA